MPSVLLNFDPSPRTFQIDQGTVGLFPDGPGDPPPSGFVMAEPGPDHDTTIEHWFLLPSYSPPSFNSDGSPRSVVLRRIPPASITPGLSQYGVLQTPPVSEFVEKLKAAFPNAAYLRAVVVKQ